MKDSDLFWFLAYCAVTYGFLVLGAEYMHLHWFWNVLFAFPGAAAFVCAGVWISRARRCPWSVAKAINAGRTSAVQAIVEGAFGDCPDLSDPAGAWGGAGVIAYLPITIAAYVCLGPVIPFGFARALVAPIVSILFAVVVGMIAHWAAAEKRMMDRVRETITAHNSEAWDAMVDVWSQRGKTRLGAMKQQEEGRKARAENAAEETC